MNQDRGSEPLVSDPDPRPRAPERFEFLFRVVKGGHRFFLDRINKRIAIADESGATPDRTEDRTLWVNFDQPIHIDADGHISLALQNEKGEDSSTPICMRAALFLADKYNLRIRTTNDKSPTAVHYRIIKV